ncbi:DoxX family protein [Pseudomonas caspiana]|uniref:DoxX family protein n=1 Tax=Pseudomonas caspiana TaxID=1451454 RepID=A0A1Y3P110_9PSED|nr:DoxX family protein [Pseudomonas caspiana]OUM73507.1 DoxX family protein [Pseudomonas caspiana]
MNMPKTTPNTHSDLRARWDRLTECMQQLVNDSLLSLIARISIAAIFLMSARTKVEGFMTISPKTYDLFEMEYNLPLISPVLAAQLATYAEHVFPLLLIVGLLTRLSALALLFMTVVIQVFVYPDAWATHLSWAGLLLVILGRGAGLVSMDRMMSGK